MFLCKPVIFEATFIHHTGTNIIGEDDYSGVQKERGSQIHVCHSQV